MVQRISVQESDKKVDLSNERLPPSATSPHIVTHGLSPPSIEHLPPPETFLHPSTLRPSQPFPDKPLPDEPSSFDQVTADSITFSHHTPSPSFHTSPFNRSPSHQLILPLPTPPHTLLHSSLSHNIPSHHTHSLQSSPDQHGASCFFPISHQSSHQNCTRKTRSTTKMKRCHLFTRIRRKSLSRPTHPINPAPTTSVNVNEHSQSYSTQRNPNQNSPDFIAEPVGVQIKRPSLPRHRRGPFSGQQNFTLTGWLRIFYL